MRRWILIGLGVVIALVAAVVLFVFSSLDSIVEAAIEDYGPDILGTDVSVASVELSPTSGEGTISGLVVGSPPGFEADRTLSLGRLAVALDPATVMESTIVIREIAIDAPEITYELSSGGSNLDAIQRHIEDQLGAPQEPAAEEEGPTLIIDRFALTGGVVNVKATGLGDGLSVPLPDLVLTEIGRQSGGATAAEAMGQIFGAVTRAVGRAVVSFDDERLKGLLSSGAEGVKGVLEQGGEGVKGILEEGGEGLRGLFGR